MKIRSFIVIAGLVLVSVTVFNVCAEPVKGADDSKELFRQIQLFADSVSLITRDYVEPVKIKDLVYGAIRGMMDTLDGYSQFMDPESFKEITEDTRGEFGGVGMEVGMRDGVLTVIAPMEDTPAYEAGIKTDDKIVKIDGETTRDITLDESVKKLRGDPGTTIKLTVVRESEDKALNFTLTRQIIKLKSIKNPMVIADNIGYVRITEFQERTARDLRKSINDLKKKGIGSLVIDLRNNPGGLLDAAVEVSDLFLEPGEMVVYTEGRVPDTRIDFRAKKAAIFRDMVVVILVNKGSASASEIFAGALKDNKRALLLGAQTFGKGSVQTVIPLKDESALRLTTAAYFTPSGKNLRDKGIEPDIWVEEKPAGRANDIAKKKEQKEKEKNEVFNKVRDEDKKKARDEDKKKEGAGREERRSKDKDVPEGAGKGAEPPEQEEKTGGVEKDAAEKLLENDNQLQAAVNVLKGAEIFRRYKAPLPEADMEKAVPEGEAKDENVPVEEEVPAAEREQ
ncbi:MAG: S41 family peptidase [Candidatus Omnitrophota bacterium]